MRAQVSRLQKEREAERERERETRKAQAIPTPAARAAASMVGSKRRWEGSAATSVTNVTAESTAKAPRRDAPAGVSARIVAEPIAGVAERSEVAAAAAAAVEAEAGAAVGVGAGEEIVEAEAEAEHFLSMCSQSSQDTVATEAAEAVPTMEEMAEAEAVRGVVLEPAAEAMTAEVPVEALGARTCSSEAQHSTLQQQLAALQADITAHRAAAHPPISAFERWKAVHTAVARVDLGCVTAAERACFEPGQCHVIVGRPDRAHERPMMIRGSDHCGRGGGGAPSSAAKSAAGPRC